MRKLLLIAGAVCALAFLTANADAAHGCNSGYGYGGGQSSYYGGGHGGYGIAPSYNYGHGGHGHGYNNFYAPQQRVYGYNGHGHNQYGPGVHIGGRRLNLGIHF